jgi:hypothetical protein
VRNKEKLVSLTWIFLGPFALANCKTSPDPETSVYANKSSIEQLGPATDSRLIMSRRLDAAFKGVGLSHGKTTKTITKPGELRFHFTSETYWIGNMVSIQTETCVGIKSGEHGAKGYEIKLLDGGDSGCVSFHIYALNSDESRMRIVANHEGKFGCLQVNGYTGRATVADCLISDPGNIQTFNWDRGKPGGWGLVRQSGDGNGVLCLDISNATKFDEVIFYNCSVTNNNGRGLNQRFYFKEYPNLIPNEKVVNAPIFLD